MAGKGLNLFDEYAGECVHLYTHSAPLLPESTIKCTHLSL